MKLRALMAIISMILLTLGGAASPAVAEDRSCHWVGNVWVCWPPI